MQFWEHYQQYPELYLTVGEYNKVFNTNKEKTMNEMAPNNTPTAVDFHPDFDDLPDFLKQAIKDGKPVEIQTEEEVVGEDKKPTREDEVTYALSAI